MKKIFSFLIVLSMLAFPFLNLQKAFALTQNESVIVGVIEKNSPSVVTIVIEKQEPPSGAPVSGNSPLNSLFNSFKPKNIFTSFFTDFPTLNTQVKKQEAIWNIGTGFIVSNDGLIITAKHVVKDQSASYFVMTKDNKKIKVNDIYRDPSYELAILKVQGNNLSPVELGNSDDVKVGQMAIAVGTALGELNNSVTAGIVSGTNRDITVDSPSDGTKKDRLTHLIQTDAAINYGNSGGPLFDSSGKAIGVNTIAAVGENIGFAIPINTVKKTLETYKSNH